MSVKVVVFDYGGVICFLPPHATRTKLEQLTGLPDSILIELHRKYRGEWDRGTYDGAAYYRFILSEMGVFLDSDSLARIVQADTDGWRRVNPATVQLMENIKASGLRLGILSNMPHDFLAWARSNIRIINVAAPAVFSCECNMIKPEKGIYEKLREETGCEYHEIVFFDDNNDNIVMARELGIQAYVWEGPDAARKLLINLEPELRLL